MTGLKFDGNKSTRLLSPELNAIAYVTRNGITADCEVIESSPSAMTIDVSQGTAFFGNDIIAIAEQADIVIAANATSNERLDLVALDNVGVASILQGTAALIALPPDYDPDTYIILAVVTIIAGATSIVTSNISDNRVLNIGGGSSGGEGINRFVEPFTSQTSVTVTHNLGDDEPIVQAYDSSGIRIPESAITSITIDDTNELTVVFGSSKTGHIIVHGGKGGTAYYSEPFSSASTWNINHNLGRQFVEVSAYDSSNIRIPDSDITSITLDDADNLTIVFGSAKVGQVVVTGGSTKNQFSGSELTPIASGDADDNSIFLDSSDTVIKMKDNVSIISPLVTPDLGEVKMFALSISGATSKATLQAKGWAICDGTTSVSQGISSPTIVTTPDLQDKFIKMSNDETSGSVGGSETHNHQFFNEAASGATITVAGAGAFTDGSYDAAGNVTNLVNNSGVLDGDYYTNKVDTKPPFYEMAFFIKVKV